MPEAAEGLLHWFIAILEAQDIPARTGRGLLPRLHPPASHACWSFPIIKLAPTHSSLHRLTLDLPASLSKESRALWHRLVQGVGGTQPLSTISQVLHM